MITTFYPPDSFGGDGVYVERLARALARRGHEIDVICSRDAYRALSTASPPPAGQVPDREADLPIRVHRIAGRFGRLSPILAHQLGIPVAGRKLLRRVMVEARPDVLHFHNVSLVGGPAILTWGQSLRLYSAHEYWLVCPTHLLFRFDREICTDRTCIRCTLAHRRPPQLWRYTGFLERAVAGLDSVLSPSRLTASIYQELLPGVPVTVMPHFLPEEYRVQAQESGPRRATGSDYLLYVGRLARVKGVHEILPAFVDGTMPAPLWIAGTGPEEASLRAIAGDSPMCRFLGAVTPEGLHRLYRDAVGLVLPSAGYETFGLVALEAMAHGTPVIARETAGAAEVISACGGGVVYASIDELRAALRRLVDDPEHRDEMGLRGQQYLAGKHGELDYVRDYEALIDRLRSRRDRAIDRHPETTPGWASEA